jgi:hypothetical protein
MSSRLEDLFDRLGSLISSLAPRISRKLADAFVSMAVGLLGAIVTALHGHRWKEGLVGLADSLKKEFAILKKTGGPSTVQIEGLKRDYTTMRERAGLSPFLWSDAPWRKSPEEGSIVRISDYRE